MSPLSPSAKMAWSDRQAILPLLLLLVLPSVIGLEPCSPRDVYAIELKVRIFEASKAGTLMLCMILMCPQCVS